MFKLLPRSVISHKNSIIILCRSDAPPADGIRSELADDIRVNINTADVAALEALPSIGHTRAQAIVDYRTAHGNFASIEDLDAVPGIGPATIVIIRSRITI